MMGIEPVIYFLFMVLRISHDGNIICIVFPSWVSEFTWWEQNLHYFPFMGLRISLESVLFLHYGFENSHDGNRACNISPSWA